VTNTAERDPPPPRIVAYLATKKHLPSATKKHKMHKKKESKIKALFLCSMCFFVAKKSLWLTEGELAGAALFKFKITANFEQSIEHFRTLCTARGELRIGLFVHVLQPVKFVGNM